MESPHSFFRRNSDSTPNADFYLEAATKALNDNCKKLAIHLYIAAYELDKANTNNSPGIKTVNGLEDAWAIACDISDRSSAETLFAELANYSSPEQVSMRAKQLQDMTINQLQEMGIPSDRIERTHKIYSPEATLAGVDPTFINKLFNMINPQDMSKLSEEMSRGIETSTNRLDASEVGNELLPELLPNSLENSDIKRGQGDGLKKSDPYQRSNDENEFIPSNYSSLVGYDEALKSMRVFGFQIDSDDAYRQFVRENTIFHGMEGQTPYDPFLFYGSSRDDVFEFAQATAGEIGNPVVVLHVRTDDEGVWTIKLSGPFRKSLFGMSDPTDIPTPCTFIIENIDILQDFIKIASSQDQYLDMDMPNPNARVYGEIMGYIHTILQKKDVFPILTAKDNIDLTNYFAELFDRLQRIKIDYPTFDERKAVWNKFSLAHTSFSDINIDELSELSEGVSRHDMVIAGKNAVRDVFQESLVNNVYRFVSLNDVLFELIPFAAKENVSSAIEDAAVEAFADELDEFDFAEEIFDLSIDKSTSDQDLSSNSLRTDNNVSELKDIFEDDDKSL